MPTPPLPTGAELEILRVLWQRGPSTVREVQEALHAVRGSGYTTVLKFLQIMHGKGLVTRDARATSHVYAAAVAREATEHRLVADLAARAFEGSPGRLALRALAERRASPEELREIRLLLQQLEGEGA
ncbi:MAG TPA: BlaI/MecI/CopY family transcriptional regulator [Gemmatimonadaceae bacterium]|nr:BlaI/MecI/CopY family transcriptional regulator [Gemmatimonadaceae bacterium]